MKRMTQIVLAAMFALLLGSQSWAIEASFKQENVLNGITIHYRYTHGWEYEVRFYDNMLEYTSLSTLRSLMEQQDKDKDGRVTRDEFTADQLVVPVDIEMNAELEEILAERDKNADGIISEEEKFHVLDKNGDGAITEQEARPTKPDAKDIPYHVKQIGDNMYAVFWHQPNMNVVTLIINFNTSTLYGFGVVVYGSEQMREEFYHGAIIQGVKKN